MKYILGMFEKTLVREGFQKKTIKSVIMIIPRRNMMKEARSIWSLQGPPAVQAGGRRRLVGQPVCPVRWTTGAGTEQGQRWPEQEATAEPGF